MSNYLKTSSFSITDHGERTRRGKDLFHYQNYQKLHLKNNITLISFTGHVITLRTEETFQYIIRYEES